MPRAAVNWGLALAPLVAVWGCQVDDRTVICDPACQSGELQGGSGGSESVTGGSAATGGSKSTGGSASTGGSKSTAGGSAPTGGSKSIGGASSTGGGKATGGVAGTGAPNCKSNVVALGTSPVIDDFEDSDPNLEPNEGRLGFWVHLRSGQLLTTGGLPASIVTESGSTFMRISGLGIPAMTEYAWANVKSDLKGIGTSGMPMSCVYDASVYSGIKFRARGVQVRVSLEMDLDVPASNTYGAPGACTRPDPAACYDRHTAVVPLTSSWGAYTLYWEDLAQVGYTDWHPAFDPTRLLGIYFEVVAASGGSIPAYQIDIDDVEFVP
jgi:hypothetical protein